MRGVTSALFREGRVRRTRIGLAGQTVPVPRTLARHHRLTAEGGVKVLSVEKGSPAEAAGVLPGDVIVPLDGAAVSVLRLTDRRELTVVPRESA